jgi:integrase
VITRLLRLTALTIEVRAGRAVRKHKLVKSGGPDDLVFQSVQKECPMNDQNILKRHLQSATRKLGLPFVNWRCLRTSHATWLVQSGADPKSVQGQMRHSRISTTMDIYAQIVPASQRRALRRRRESAGAATDGFRSRFFGARKRRPGITVQFTVQNGAIKQASWCSIKAKNSASV